MCLNLEMERSAAPICADAFARDVAVTAAATTGEAPCDNVAVAWWPVCATTDLITQSSSGTVCVRNAAPIVGS